MGSPQKRDRPNEHGSALDGDCLNGEFQFSIHMPIQPETTSSNPRWSSAAAVASVFLLIPAMCLSAPLPGELSPAARLIASERPLVIAHRGYSAHAPENASLAFEYALDAGADLVELDYHHSADGVPVVIHDGSLDRTTDAVALWGGKDLPVAKRTWEELKKLDAGRWFQTQVMGQRILSLSEALELIQARGVTLIERKAGDPATLARLLNERSLVNQVVVQAFDWNFLEGFHRLEPRQVLGALGPPGSRDGRKLTDPEKELNEGWLSEIQKIGAQIAVWNRQVDAESIRRAHELGLKIWVYTIDDGKVAAQLLDWGVDGIITNNPAVIWRTQARRGK